MIGHDRLASLGGRTLSSFLARTLLRFSVNVSGQVCTCSMSTITEQQAAQLRDSAAQPPPGEANSVTKQLVNHLEQFELQQRGLDAVRVRFISALIDATVDSGCSSRQQGAEQRRSENRELAFRSMRAELSLAFNLSEYQIEG